MYNFRLITSLLCILGTISTFYAPIYAKNAKLYWQGIRYKSTATEFQLYSSIRL